MQNDPASDHGQVSRQTTVAAKAAQYSKVVVKQRQEDLRRKILPVLQIQIHGIGSCRMIERMDHHTKKPIDKILPATPFALQTCLQKTAIEF